MSNFAQQLCTRLDQLKSARANYESHWSECYKYGAPERQQSFSSSTVDNSKTQQQQRADLYDSTAADSVQVLVSMIMNFLNGVCRHEQGLKPIYVTSLFLNGVCRHERD